MLFFFFPSFFPEWLYNLILGKDDRLCKKKFYEILIHKVFCINEERLVS